MNKICTSIEQSKKLIELGIDVNTADMYLWSSGRRYYIEAMDDGDFNEKEGHVRAWSLTTLFNFILPSIIDDNGNVYKFYLSKDGLNRWIAYYKSDNVSIHICEESYELLDVIFEMVCWLLENKKI
jgi:hypothetical protein